MIIWIEGTYGVGKSTIASKNNGVFFWWWNGIVGCNIVKKILRQIMADAKIKNIFFP